MITATLPEEDLIRRVKDRDEDAWSELYDLYYPSLYRYAFARLRSREEAEDVAAQVFLEALRGIDRFAYRGRPMLAWLYRIARNLIADTLRYQIRKDRAHASQLPGEREFAPAADESLETLELLDAISKLTIDQQEVLILRFFMALPAKATAEMLGKNETAVFALQVRAIGALRRIMSPRAVSLEAVRAA
jgi:RNA polymerase sigma-70 factor (ECF subfamily)